MKSNTIQITTTQALVLALALVQTLNTQYVCGGVTINHTGRICDYSTFTLYQNAQALCEARNNVFGSLAYCAVAECTACNSSANSLLRLYQQFTDFDSAVKFTSDSTGQLNLPVGNCKLSTSEQVYRETTQDAYFQSHYSPVNDNPNNLDKCCLYECDDKFSLQTAGCGSNSLVYTDLRAFCEAFCNNRSLTLTQCGDPGCGAAQGCPSESSVCQLTFPSGGVCATTDGTAGFTLYTDATNYCNALSNNLVSRYTQNFCQQQGGRIVCNDDDCALNSCNADLITTGYDANQVCGFLGAFYPTIVDYCTAVNTDVEIFFVLCNGRACGTEQACCARKCQNSFVSLPLCTANGTYITDRATFCTHSCGGGSTTGQLCNGGLCLTAADCCQAACPNQPAFAICVNGNLQINTQNCAQTCNANNNIKKCFDVSGNQRNCVTTDCNSGVCVASLGDATSFCIDGTLYTDKNEVCNVTGGTPNVTLCNGAPCTTAAQCCRAQCAITNTGFTGGCDTNFNDFLDVDSYCTAFCNDTSLQLYRVSNRNATLGECCNARCVANDTAGARCNSSFALVTVATYCSNTCSGITGATYTTCDGGCDVNDCQVKQCEAETLPDYTTEQVCGTDAVFYTNKTAFCTQKVNTNTSLAVASCNGERCTTQAACCQRKCIADNTSITTAFCTTNGTVYSNVSQYCTDFCANTAADIKLCNGVLCSPAECCATSCTNVPARVGCTVGFTSRLISVNDCLNTCSGTPNPTNVVFCEGRDCVAADCKIQSCVQILTTTQGNAPVCGNDGVYYSSPTPFCTAYNGDAFSQNLCPNTTLCANATECCLDACVSATYQGFCSSSFRLLTQAEYCNSKCAGGATFVTCTGGCTQAKCDALAPVV